MALNTFHYAGVSSKNITLGVLWLKEFINVATNIKTPLLAVYLEPDIAQDRTMAKNLQQELVFASLRTVTATVHQFAHSAALLRRSRRSGLVFPHQRKLYVWTHSAQRASSPWLQKAYSVAKIEDLKVMDKATQKPKLGSLMDPCMDTIDRNFKCQTYGEGMSEYHRIRMAYFSLRCVPPYLLLIHPTSHTPGSNIKGSNIYV